jgi:hypothetical protein
MRKTCSGAGLQPTSWRTQLKIPDYNFLLATRSPEQSIDISQWVTFVRQLQLLTFTIFIYASRVKDNALLFLY